MCIRDRGKVGVKVQVANLTDKEQKVRVQAVMTDPKGVDPAGETVPLVLSLIHIWTKVRPIWPPYCMTGPSTT